MTGRPRMGGRVASDTLLAWEAVNDRVRAEYRYRERQAPGSGDAWLAARVELVEAAEAEDSRQRIAQSLTQSPTGVFDAKDRAPRAPARRRARGLLSRARSERAGGGAA